MEYSGASPELIESDVTDIVEGALVGVEGVRNIYSSSRFGSASVTLEFDLKRNIDAAIQDVQAALQGVLRQLPKDMNAPVVTKSNPEDRPILWLAFSGKHTLREINSYAKNTLSDQFSSLDGVSEVLLGGALEPQIRVWLDPTKLTRYHLTPSDVIASISSEHVEIPAGRILQEKTETNLRILGEAVTVDELSKIPITHRSGSPVYELIRIGDLGKSKLSLAQGQPLP
jgi:HAE1 family hydrophobic/amphiphilic exporter-1